MSQVAKRFTARRRENRGKFFTRKILPVLRLGSCGTHQHVSLCYNFCMQPIIVTTLYLLSALIPLTFTTINSELFEFPKFILLLSGTLVIVVSWAFHIYKTHDFKIKLNFMSYSILAILTTQTLATIFSISPYTSFWGYYSRFHQGLLTTICYTIIYFAATKWLDKKSTLKLIKISVGTSILISLFAILERLGIDKAFWVQDVQNRPFATLGQPNWLAAYVIPNIFLAIYLGITGKKKNWYLSGLIYTILLTALLFTKSRSGLLGFVLAYIAYWAILLRQFNFAKIKHSFLLYSGIMLSIIIILGSALTPSITSMFTQAPTIASPAPQGTALETGGTESGDIRKIVWTGALKLIAKYPLLGTGPETFAYTYYWTRPLAHNLTSEWDFLYNKAHNEYLNIAAGAGIIGLLAYLSWHVAILIASLTRISRSKKITQDQEDNLRMFYPVLGACVIGFAVTNFFGFSVIPVYLMMTIIAAMPIAINLDPTKSTQPIPYALYFILPLVLIYPARIYLADINYAKGKAYFDAGQIGPAIQFLQNAVKSRPGLDLYHATLGEAYAAAGQKELALQEVNTNRALNPYHLNFYKSRAKIYLTLATVDPSFHVQAAQELESARKLAPTDPKLAYNLGLVYTRLSDASKAEAQLKDAISLKPNYIEPYYALTLLYEQSKQPAKIVPLLTQAKTNLATYSAQLREKIEKYLH